MSATPTTSRLEELRDELMGYLAEVNGEDYRTKIVTLSKQLPNENTLNFDQVTVAVLFGDELVYAEDVTAQVISSQVQVLLLGFCRPEVQEALGHDLKRVIVKHARAHAGKGNNQWLFRIGKGSSTLKIARDNLPRAGCWVGVMATAELLYQQGTF